MITLSILFCTWYCGQLTGGHIQKSNRSRSHANINRLEVFVDFDVSTVDVRVAFGLMNKQFTAVVILAETHQTDELSALGLTAIGRMRFGHFDEQVRYIGQLECLVGLGTRRA